MNELIKPTRRGFIIGLTSLFAAPAIVRASSLMPVSGALLTSASLLSSEEIAALHDAALRALAFNHSLSILDQITKEAVRIFYENRGDLHVYANDLMRPERLARGPVFGTDRLLLKKL